MSQVRAIILFKANQPLLSELD